MKTRVIVIEILLFAAAIWLFLLMQRPGEAPDLAPGETLEKSFPPHLIFRLAFWRPPTPEDRILHADRREWSDAQGVTRWEAFLAVEPGPALHEWLATNPFSLATVPSMVRDIPKPPAWFPKKTAGFTIQQALHGHMVLLTAPGGSPVYLADHGKGFARVSETPVPATPAPTPTPANRLPNARPPLPKS